MEVVGSPLEGRRAFGRLSEGSPEKEAGRLLCGNTPNPSVIRCSLMLAQLK